MAGKADQAAVTALRAQVSEDEWIDAGFAIPTRQEYGCFVGDDLCALALSHPSAAPRPTSACSRRPPIATGASAQRRFLEENRPAVRIARALGYV